MPDRTTTAPGPGSIAEHADVPAVRAVAALFRAAGRPLAFRVLLNRRRDVAQRSIEILIGRLITDEAFRAAFRRNARATLTGFIESGYELTPLEITALRATPAGLWERVAAHIDPRLQKASFTRTASVDPEEEA